MAEKARNFLGTKISQKYSLTVYHHRRFSKTKKFSSSIFSNMVELFNNATYASSLIRGSTIFLIKKKGKLKEFF